VLVDTYADRPGRGRLAGISSDNKAGGADASPRSADCARRGQKCTRSYNNKHGIAPRTKRTAGLRRRRQADPEVSYSEALRHDTARARPRQGHARGNCRRTPAWRHVPRTQPVLPPRDAATGIRQAGKSGKVKVVGFDDDPDHDHRSEAGHRCRR